jgi:hypothetical protein
MSGPFAVRVVADVGTAGDVVHGNGTAYDLLGFPSSGAAARLAHHRRDAQLGARGGA